MLLRVTIVLAASFLAACGSPATDPIGDACDDYCTLVMRNCQGTVAQYPDISTCEATCANLALGNPEDEQGNTIGCRTFWAAIAEGMDAASCRRAGPGGDGTCGTNCESFCATTLSICADQPNPPYASLADCAAQCATYDATDEFAADDFDGNNLACRIYHMTAASTDPDSHCSHTIADSIVCL